MIAGSRPALNRVAWEAGFLTHNFCTSNSFTHNSGTQLVHAQAHTQLFHNFLTKNSFTHNCFTLIHHNVLTHFSHTQLFHIQLLYLSILHHLPCLSSLPRPASTSVLIIGRSWLVGLSGPLFVFWHFQEIYSRITVELGVVLARDHQLHRKPTPSRCQKLFSCWRIPPKEFDFVLIWLVFLGPCLSVQQGTAVQCLRISLHVIHGNFAFSMRAQCILRPQVDDGQENQEVDAGNSWKILWRHAEEMTMNVDIFLFSEILCGYFPFNPKGCLNAKSKTLMRYERETDGTQHPPSPSWLLFARGVVVSACIHIFVKLCSWMPPYVYIYI